MGSNPTTPTISAIGFRFGGAQAKLRESRSAGAPEILTEAQVRNFERENLCAALRQTGWKIGGVDGAASLLGVKPTTLASRIKKLQIQRPV